MRAFVAVVAYVVGGLGALGIAFGILHGVAHGDPWPYAAMIVVAVVPWWIAAGIGVRLGMRPEEFFRGVARFAGFTSLR